MASANTSGCVARSLSMTSQRAGATAAAAGAA
jgi:hypothetical protein